MPNYLIYIIIFVSFFVVVYVLYYFLAIKSRIKVVSKKKVPKKKNNELSEVLLLQKYYGIDTEKIGMIKVYRTINFVNALMIAILVMITIPFKDVTIKIIILVVLMIPSIWVTYYFLAKYLKKIERKSE